MGCVGSLGCVHFAAQPSPGRRWLGPCEDLWGGPATWGVWGAEGGQPPRCASFLTFLGRAAGWRGRGGASCAAGMQTPERGKERRLCLLRSGRTVQGLRGTPHLSMGDTGDGGGPVTCVVCSFSLHFPGVLLCACIRSSVSQGRANPILDITELGQGGPTPATSLLSILQLKTSRCRRQRLGGECPTYPQWPTVGGLPHPRPQELGGWAAGGPYASIPRGMWGAARPCAGPVHGHFAAGEHSREAGVGPAPRGRERGLLWKRFCIRIKS